MLRLAIVDDTPADSAALRALVADYFQKNEQAYMIQVFNAQQHPPTTSTHLQPRHHKGANISQMQCTRW